VAFIDPEVFADLAQASFTGKVKVLGSTAVKSDNTLEGVPGSTITFPKWGALGELDDLTKGVAMTPASMSQTSNTATIKEAGKAVLIDDADKLTILGGQGGAETEAIRQFGVLAARKVDGDLITEAVANAGHALAPGAVALSWSVLVDHFAQYGDEFEPDEFAGIWINSAQMATLFKDSQFIDASKIGDSSVVRTGTLGNIGGIPVSLTNRVAAGTVLTLKHQVLGALYKRRPLVETDRDILKRQDVYTTNVHYAVKAIDTAGVGKITGLV
jgi:hypothetical protein